MDEILLNIPLGINSTVLSIGSGNQIVERKLALKIKYCDCIDKVIYDKDKTNINNPPPNLNFLYGDFTSYKFTKKYNVLLFLSSLQFIIGNDSIDIKYLDFIFDKIYNLVKNNGHIFIKIPQPEWFYKNKPLVSNEFISTLINTPRIIKKIKGFILVTDYYDVNKDYRYLIYKKNKI